MKTTVILNRVCCWDALLDRGDAAAEQAAQPETKPADTILIVDDETTILSFVSRFIGNSGRWKVADFSSPVAALAAFRADPDRYRAVVTDFNMPGMTGGELIASIRKLRPDMPAILMTAASAAELSDLHFDERLRLLPKPFGLADLLGNVSAATNETGT